MENETLKQQITKWIERYRWAVDSLQILPCSVSFVAGGITVLCPNAQTAAAVGALPNYGVPVTVSTG